jgi:NhaA family Na+:H+ antiporter
MDALPDRRPPRIVRRFVATESAGGVVLLVAAVVGLVWANSPWRAGYEALWSTVVAVGVGHWSLSLDLHHWVNDGLMALFFFVVGMEIKREVVVGDLRDRRAAAVPVVAALGGMAVPALVYLALNAGGAGARGWGIPMATDIAFALAVVALLGPRVPPSLKLFLLTLAIVDDIGAITVIALFYTDDVDVMALALAGGLALAIVGLRAARVTWLPPYLALAAGLWLAVHASGVHATIAGVVLGLLVPVRPRAPAALAKEWAADLDDEPTAAELATMSRLAGAAASPAERFEHHLHPWTSFAVVPLFALANTGIELTSGSLRADDAAPVALGVVLGLVVGKLVGIAGATWLAVRTGLGRLPEGASWKQLVGVAAVGGIGFTVSLFVADLAFPSAPELRDAAKLAVLSASVLAALLGSAVLLVAARRPPG